MFCERCGAQIEDDALFCEKCGSKIEHEIKESESVQSIPIMQTVPPMQTPIAPKTPMSKGMKILLAEIAVLIIAMIAFYKIGEKQFGPEAIADQYFMAESKGDWDMVYEMMDLPDSNMLSKEMFLSVYADSKLINVTNYKVTEDGFGKLNKDDMLRTFRCEYMASGNHSMSTEEIQLVKQKDKKWLLFDHWKVSPNSNLVEDYSITIPLDATAAINGTNIEELAGKPDATQNTVKCYTLPKAFAGQYELTVKAPYREDYIQYISIEDYSSCYVNDMNIQADILAQIAPVCNNAVEQLYAYALSGKIYDEFRNTLGENITTGFDATYFYEGEKERLTNDSYAEYTQVNIPEIVYQYDGAGIGYDTGNLRMSCRMQYTCFYEGYDISTDWWTGEVNKEPMNDRSRDCYMSMYLELIDGQWKITQIS